MAAPMACQGVEGVNVKAFRRHAWVLRNVGVGLLGLGWVLQMRDQSDGPFLMLFGFGLALAAALRNKMDQDLKIAALKGYEDALNELAHFQGSEAQKLLDTGWDVVMVDSQRRKFYDQARQHYEAVSGLRHIPLRPSWPRLRGRQLEEWAFVAEQVLRAEPPAHQR